MNLYYQSQGSGQPFIIVHGLFGSSDNWRSMAKYFAKWYQVISIDLRNHGRSPHAGSQTFEAMAEDIYTLCTKLNLQKIYLLGHSLGGKAAMKFTELHPNMVEKLIVVDIAPRQYQGEHTPMMDAMMAIDFSTLASRSEVDDLLAETITDKTVRQFLLMNLVADNKLLKWRINLPALKANYREYMQPVCQTFSSDIAALFLYGEQSDYVSQHDQREIEAIFSNVEFAAMPTGHWPHAERPQQFKNTLEAFLND